MSTRDRRPLIAHVVYRFEVGGLENGIVNLINRLPPDRYRHAVVALTEVTDFRRRIQSDDVQYVSLHKPTGHGWHVWPRLTREFRRLEPTIVHTRNLAALEAMVPAWVAGVPVRIHGEHGRDVSDLDGLNRAYQLIRRAYRPFIHAHVALSHDLEGYLIERIGVSRTSVRHLWNGVDERKFYRAVDGRTPISGCSFNDPSLFIVGTVGRMEAVKDPLNLARGFIQAVTRDRASRLRLRLVFVGDGSQRSAVERTIKDSGLDSIVWFAGERSDVADVLRGLDCFVLPSLAEGISNTIMEAMASSLPVIATSVGANADMVEDGVSGRIVPRADSAAIAQSILEYSIDPFKARLHGRAGRQIIESRFSLDRMVNEYDRLYTDLLAQRVPGVLSAGACDAIHD